MVREASPKSHKRIPWLWSIFIVSTILTSTRGLNITSSLSRYYVARGDSVSLQCEFTLAPEDLGHLEIEWFLKSADNRKEDKPLMWYDYDRIHGEYDGSHFSSVDPQDGDASLTLRDVELTDTGTYQCKVKKAPGTKSKIMQVLVMEKIFKPKCVINGDVELGNKLRVNCSVSQGDRPIQFHWEKITGDRLFPENRTHFDSIQGDLYIKDLQATDSGTYRCTAANCVSEEYCDLILLPASPSSAVTINIVVVLIVVMVTIVTITTVMISDYCRMKFRRETFQLLPYKWMIGKRRAQHSAEDDCMNVVLKSWIQLESGAKEGPENTVCVAMGTNEEITLKDDS